jgi:diguanylate cyclase (GGDEF)-like protein
MRACFSIIQQTVRGRSLGLLATVAAAVIGAAAYMSVLIIERQQALSGISRYNLTWAASQSVTELLRLEQVVATYALPDSDVDQDEIGVRLDVMANRVSVMQHGQLDDLVQETPELQAIVRDLARATEAARPLLERIDQPGATSAILNLFKPLNARMAHLAARAHAFSGESVARDQQELDTLHWIFSGLLMVLIMFGVGLVVLLVRNAGAIRRAHDELRGLTDELGHAAHHDALTGLPNRVLFHKEATRAVNSHKARGESFAVLFLDLDRFKEVNDTMGHPVGDALLREVAQRLRGCMRPTDIVARLGGDEFAVVLNPISRPEQAAGLAERLIEVVSAPYAIDGQCVIVGTSVGAAVCPTDGLDSDELLKNADIALYRAKEDGRATYRFFHPKMDSDLQHQRAIAIDLRLALVRSEFEVFYQPLVNLDTGLVAGAEALIRWNSGARGMICPADFIPVAEESGLIRPLGAWVLQQACAEAACWPDNMKVAVNLSPKQFSGGKLVQDVADALEAAGLRPDRLELEITESVLLQDSAAVLKTLHELRSLGVRIALDDFGTGYSSLSYLRSFPFDKIKIDQCFVQDLAVHTNSMHIIQAVVTLARNLGMTTTAEGIETQDQRLRLHAAGCSEGQGYLFERPVRASELRKLLAPSVYGLAA